MNRYWPTDEERTALEARGWTVDEDGWWWPVRGWGYARTYREAMREAARQDKRNGAQP